MAPLGIPAQWILDPCSKDCPPIWTLDGSLHSCVSASSLGEGWCSCSVLTVSPGQLQSVLHFCVYRQIQFVKRKANRAKPCTSHLEEKVVTQGCFQQQYYPSSFLTPKTVLAHGASRYSSDQILQTFQLFILNKVKGEVSASSKHSLVRWGLGSISESALEPSTGWCCSTRALHWISSYTSTTEIKLCGSSSSSLGLPETCPAAETQSFLVRKGFNSSTSSLHSVRVV